MCLDNFSFIITMAKITIAGNSFVVTSAVQMSDLEVVKKYRPAALALADEDTKEVYFKVGINPRSRSITDFGVTFGGVTNNDEKLTTATIQIPSEVAEFKSAKEYVLDKAGLAIANLDKIEAAIKVEKVRLTFSSDLVEL